MSNLYRSITTHHIDEGSRKLTIQAVEPLDKDQAPHTYWIQGAACHTCISFQKGPAPEVGVNGVTEESLLAILADRLQSLQETRDYSPENEAALICIDKALKHLNKRPR